jgi:hypothetical protein
MIDYNQIDDVVVDGINYRDYPDFCDAYISEATIDGRPASDEEIEELNKDRDFVYDKVMDKIY